MAMHALNYALTHILTQNVAMQNALNYALKIFALTHNLTQRKRVAMQIALNYALEFCVNAYFHATQVWPCKLR